MELRQLSPVFKIRKISELKLSDIHSLCECIAQYIQRAEPGVRLDNVLSLLHKNMETGAVWFLYKKTEVTGFLACALREDMYGNKICVVDFFGVNEEARQKGLARQMADIGIAWVKQQNINKILFGTTRNAKAMCRLLPGNWEIDSTVVSLCL